MDAYIIVGSSNVGKSSLVRALTGVRNSEVRLMQTSGGMNFRLWAKDSSLQEAGMAPQDYIAHANVQQVNAVLLTMWIRSRRSRGITYPGADGYVADFIAAGWNINPVAAINSAGAAGIKLPIGVTATTVLNNKIIPFNLVASHGRSL